MAGKIIEARKANMKSGVFDFYSAEEFFRSIKNSYKEYLNEKEKMKNLLYVVMGLNHLREWIAPTYEKKKNGRWPETDNENELFSKMIYEHNDFKMLRSVCNSTKHFKYCDTRVEYGTVISEWKNLSNVQTIKRGYPKGYFINDRNINDIIDVVVDLYESKWFQRAKESTSNT